MLANQTKGHSPTNKRAEILLQKYFIQVTRGCGDAKCSNPNCVSNVNSTTQIDSQDTNASAALALRLLRTRAPLCPLFTSTDPQDSSTSNQCLSPGSCANTPPFVSASTDSAGGGETMEVAEIDNGTDVKVESHLTEHILLDIIKECESKDDYSLLRRVLGQIFYSVDAVKRSFLRENAANTRDHNEPGAMSGCAMDHCPGDGITLDLAQVRSAYRSLFAVPGTLFHQTLIDAIKYLMENVEMELKYGRGEKGDVEYLNLFILILEMPLLHEPEFIQQAFPSFCKAADQLPIEGQKKLAKFLSTYNDSQLLNVVHALQQSMTVRLLSANYERHHSVQEDEVVCAATKLLRVLYYAALYGGARDDEQHLETEKEFYARENKILEALLNQGPETEGNEQNGATNKEKFEQKTDPLGKALGVRPIDVQRGLVPFEEFYNETLSEIIEVDKDLINYKADDGRFSFVNYPFVLLPVTKVQSMFLDNRIRMFSERRHAIMQTLLGAPASPYLRLRVRRTHLVEDSLAMLEIVASESPGDLKKQLYVEFENEQGVDEGGVSKEFYQLITAQLFNPDHGMFTYDPNSRLFWFNAQSLDSAAEYTLIGTLFGLAVYNNVIVDVQFPMVVYKKLLGKLGTFDDLRDVDSTLYSSLKQLLKYEGDDFEDTFGCTFRVTCTDCYGQQVANDLKENGSEIPVTKSNRQEFVRLYADYLLNRSIEQQFNVFRRGFCMVCTSDSQLSWLFRPDEIEQLVCGSKNFDFLTLERSTYYDNGYNGEHQTVKYFWEVIHEMADEQKRLFLRFVTGSDRIPIGGMSKLKFMIARNGPDSDKLPTAHTCFNVLLLPEYGSKEKLKERLMKAITYCQGFGLM